MTDFDARAKTWDSDPMKVERARMAADAIRAALPLSPEMTAFEYGCGTGLLSFALQSNFAHITLADTSDGMLDVLTTKIADSGVSNMTPLKLDLTTDPAPVSRQARQPVSRFDITYSLMALHHIPEPETVIRQFHTLLKPGGWLAIADLDTEDGSFHAYGRSDVHPGFERASLQKQVEAVGFGEVKFSTIYEIQKNNRLYPVFLLTAQKPIQTNPDGKPSHTK